MTCIVGIGLDLVEISRLEAAIERHGDALLARLFRAGELRAVNGRARAAHVAGLFAAKEAAMKALGTGWAAGVGFRQFEIGRAPGGAPTLALHDAAAERASALGVVRAHLTITHDGASAAAVVILEGRGR
jgi:holo-[acyl-carrier protein] synthase